MKIVKTNASEKSVHFVGAANFLPFVKQTKYWIVFLGSAIY